MKRILLVAPRRGYNFGKVQRSSDLGMRFPKALMPPIDVATIKALTPRRFEVDIWDESTRGPINDETDFGKTYDLIGVTGYMTHVPWALGIARIAHKRGIPAVIGGPGVSGAPERCRGVFDVVFIGEAELTWPEFLEDWECGRHRAEYRQVQRPELSQSPGPRWDDFPNMSDDYVWGAVQTTRGCPFDCEFCDVIHLFGRQPRHKPIDTLLQEIRDLQALGMRMIFFCDDNFIGRPKYAKELLRRVIELNRTFDRPMAFTTQLTLNLADDPELLELIADANFHWVLIGIESPREASLREANKPQNYGTDLLAAIRTIQSYGILVKGNMIVGFDHDDTDIFDETYDFLCDANILNTTVSLLKAYPGTPLLARLQRDGRVVETDDDIDHTRAITNIIPKQMTRVELFEGYKGLIERLDSWDRIRDCAKQLVQGIKRVPNVPSVPPDPARAAAIQRGLQTLDDHTRTAVLDIVQTVLQHAPFMLERIASTLVRFAGSMRSHSVVIESLEKRIEEESSPGFELTAARTTLTIPTAFGNLIKWQAFPKTYEWLMRGLSDATVPEGLLNVWKAFVIRWGPALTQIEDYHLEHLRELCDRAIEQGNAERSPHSRANADVADLSGVELRRLAGEVLVAVEQDLRGAADATAPISLTLKGMELQETCGKTGTEDA
ncbi:MAG: B12-binding domain-containing radical SAM protein [Planctomycetes bacterium]|nr:B12-binding domain-containing radical SAM protein [Planctomycetota bacterium]